MNVTVHWLAAKVAPRKRRQSGAGARLTAVTITVCHTAQSRYLLGSKVLDALRATYLPRLVDGVDECGWQWPVPAGGQVLLKLRKAAGAEYHRVFGTV